jgi:sugar lactone lactonase YvrE
LVYAAGADGDVAPAQIISGSNTGLSSPSGVAVDASGNIYVSNWEANTVTVYTPGANGNVAPIATIGPQGSGMAAPAGIALDGAGNIYVSNYEGVATPARPPPAGSWGWVDVYPAGSNGNVPPSQVIYGARTGIGFPGGIAVH